MIMEGFMEYNGNLGFFSILMWIVKRCYLRRSYILIYDLDFLSKFGECEKENIWVVKIEGKEIS